MSRHTRMWSALAAAGLVGGFLPLVAFSSTASAVEGCEHEYNSNGAFSQYTCDDTTQPDTTLQVDPAPNAAAWRNIDSVTFTFAAIDPNDPDLDTMTLRCSLTGPSQSFAEQDCTSPLTITGLEDSKDPYTFSVHAVDDGGLADVFGDNERTNELWDVVTPPEVVTKDYDESPAVVTWKQDTTAPRGLIVGGPYEELTPDFPVLWARSTKYVLGSSEKPATPTCKLNSSPVSCQLGSTTLSNLSARTKTFSMVLKDPAGNVDPTLRTKRFTVPYNVIGTLSERKHWKRVSAEGYFGGDYLETRQKGAQLTKQVTFTELRLLVPKGPGLGSFRIKVGNYYFRIIDQASSTPKNLEIVLRGPKSAPMSGLLKLYTLSTKPVRFDAIMYR